VSKDRNGLSFFGKGKSELNLSLSRSEGCGSLLDCDLFPFLSGWLVHYGREVKFHLSKEVVVGAGVKVIELQVEDVVFRVSWVKKEFFVPIWVQSFLDNLGLVRLRLSLDSEFSIGVRSSTQISGFYSSCFHHSDKETRFL